MMYGIWQDVCFGVRSLLKTPGPTLVAVATLGLGIGATTAVFTYLDQALLNPYMYKDQDILVRVDSKDLKSGRRGVLRPPEYVDIEAGQRVFESIGAFTFLTSSTPASDGIDRILGARVSKDMFPTLGVEPVVGRWFSDEEMRQGSDSVILLNYSYWRDRFAQDPEIVGRELRLDDHVCTIVGVMPPGFFMGPRFYRPLVFSDKELGAQARSGQFGYVQSWAKLAPGVSVEQAQAQLSTLADALRSRYPEAHAHRGIEVFRPRDRDRKAFAEKAGFFVLPVIFVILIVCANLAHLQLTRAERRRREIGIRAAVGAGRGRLVRQLLTESLLLALVGGALGVFISYSGLDAILAIDPDRAYSRQEFIAVDQNALFFALGLSCLTGIAFGIAPALAGSRANLHEVIKDGAPQASLSRRGNRWRNLMVISEIALTSVLLVGAGLMVRNLLGAMRMDRGFDTSIVVAQSNVTSVSSDWEPAARALAESGVESLQAIPGVQSAAAGWQATLFPFGLSNYRIRPADGPDAQGPFHEVSLRPVSPSYFQTLSIPLARGRNFNASDDAGSELVAIVSQSLARQLLGDEDPLGKYLAPPQEQESGQAAERWRIVGVVRDIGWSILPGSRDWPQLYLPLAQKPTPFVAFGVRAEGDPELLASAVRERLTALNPTEPVQNLTILEQAFLNQIRNQAMAPAVIISYSVLALVLALVGIYGVTSYSMSRRTREMGIRVALGADRGDLLRLMGAQAFWVTGIGLALGAAGSLLLVRVLVSQLDPQQLNEMGLTSLHLATWIAALALLGAVSIGAAYWPVHKATSVDPMEALRYE